MRPCDCVSTEEAFNKLSEQGLRINDMSITVEPLKVVLKNGPCQLVFSMKHFQLFAEWYLKDQK